MNCGTLETVTGGTYEMPLVTDYGTLLELTAAVHPMIGMASEHDLSFSPPPCGVGPPGSDGPPGQGPGPGHGPPGGCPPTGPPSGRGPF